MEHKGDGRTIYKFCTGERDRRKQHKNVPYLKGGGT
jgi:hypothetical protein